MICIASILLLLLTAAPAAAQVEILPTLAPPLPPPMKGSPVTVIYDGGTIFRSADQQFELKLTGRMQTRFELLQSHPASTEGNQSVMNSRFLVPRTRIGMDGYIFGKDTLRYKMEGGFSDNGNPRLKDFFFDAGLLSGKIFIRAGQLKRPFNRQEIVSDFATEMPEKALTNNFAVGGRDLGIAVHNGFDRSPDGIEWIVGVFNGQGDGAVARTTCTVNAMTNAVTCSTGTLSNVPADWQPQLVARVGINTGGIRGYSEADLEGGPLRLAAAVSYKLMNIQDQASAPLSHAVQADVLIKVEGLDVQAAAFLQKLGQADAQLAGHVQGGYFITPKHAQVAARFGMTPLPLATGGDQDYTMEVRGGFNYHFQGHSWKLSNDIGMVKNTTDGAKADLQARIQGQLIF